MKGLVEVDMETGDVTSKLNQIDGVTVSEMTEEQLNQIGTNLTNILQDVNQYMSMNGGEAQLGRMQKITLKLDSHHYMNIIINEKTIKAQVDTIEAAQ